MWIVYDHFFNETHVIELYVTRLVVENSNQGDTCHNEIGPCAQSVDTTIGSIC